MSILNPDNVNGGGGLKSTIERIKKSKTFRIVVITGIVIVIVFLLLIF